MALWIVSDYNSKENQLYKEVYVKIYFGLC